MKTFKFKIATKLKEEIKDPKGIVIEDISKKLEILNSPKIKAGKYYEISFEAKDKQEADEKIKLLAVDILTNPIIETFEVIESIEL